MKRWRTRFIFLALGGKRKSFKEGVREGKLRDLKGLALTIYEVTGLNRTKKFIDIAPVRREKLRDALKLWISR